jgi:hypothetical protein
LFQLVFSLIAAINCCIQEASEGSSEAVSFNMDPSRCCKEDAGIRQFTKLNSNKALATCLLTLEVGGIVGRVEEPPDQEAGSQVRAGQQAHQPLLQPLLPLQYKLPL